MYSQFEGRKT